MFFHRVITSDFTFQGLKSFNFKERVVLVTSEHLMVNMDLWSRCCPTSSPLGGDEKRPSAKRWEVQFSSSNRFFPFKSLISFFLYCSITKVVQKEQFVKDSPSVLAQCGRKLQQRSEMAPRGKAGRGAKRKVDAVMEAEPEEKKNKREEAKQDEDDQGQRVIIEHCKS
ncbi:hypothetical protein SRHO_G00126160 [Serrasalmus rhombeus]